MCTKNTLPDTLSDALAERIRAGLQQHRARVFPIDDGQKRFWVKRAVGDKTNWFHRLQACLSALLPTAIFTPTVCTGGSAALAREIQTLTALKQRGVMVPDVIAATPEWMLLTHIGDSLHTHLKKARGPRKRALLFHGAYHLAALHQKGFALGSGCLRDMIVIDHQHIGFIDFEENPAAVMPLYVAQARNAFMYFLSTVAHFIQTPGLIREIICLYCHYAPLDTRSELSRLIRFAGPLAWLPMENGPWGKDLKEALLLIRILSRLDRENRIDYGPRTNRKKRSIAVK